MTPTDVESSIVDWLGRIATTEAPPDSAIAFNIGLFQTPTAFSAYFIGADQYDPNDSDWACSETFAPKEKCLAIPPGVFANWRDVHRAAVNATRAFLASPAARQSFFANAQAVTVGFDDGDLERVA